MLVLGVLALLSYLTGFFITGPLRGAPLVLFIPTLGFVIFLGIFWIWATIDEKKSILIEMNAITTRIKVIYRFPNWTWICMDVPRERVLSFVTNIPSRIYHNIPTNKYRVWMQFTNHKPIKFISINHTSSYLYPKICAQMREAREIYELLVAGLKEMDRNCRKHVKTPQNEIKTDDDLDDDWFSADDDAWTSLQFSFITSREVILDSINRLENDGTFRINPKYNYSIAPKVSRAYVDASSVNVFDGEIHYNRDKVKKKKKHWFWNQSR